MISQRNVAFDGKSWRLMSNDEERSKLLPTVVVETNLTIGNSVSFSSVSFLRFEFSS